jgi:hypothetical protein
MMDVLQRKWCNQHGISISGRARQVRLEFSACPGARPAGSERRSTRRTSI